MILVTVEVKLRAFGRDFGVLRREADASATLAQVIRAFGPWGVTELSPTFARRTLLDERGVRVTIEGR